MPRQQIRNARELGDTLQHVRESRNIRQQELAEDLNMSRQYLNRIETGVRNLYVSRVFRLAAKLGGRVYIEWDDTDAPS